MSKGIHQVPPLNGRLSNLELVITEKWMHEKHWSRGCESEGLKGLGRILIRWVDGGGFPGEGNSLDEGKEVRTNEARIQNRCSQLHLQILMDTPLGTGYSARKTESPLSRSCQIVTSSENLRVERNQPGFLAQTKILFKECWYSGFYSDIPK